MGQQVIRADTAQLSAIAANRGSNGVNYITGFHSGIYSFTGINKISVQYKACPTHLITIQKMAVVMR